MNVINSEPVLARIVQVLRLLTLFSNEKRVGLGKLKWQVLGLPVSNHGIEGLGNGSNVSHLLF